MSHKLDHRTLQDPWGGLRRGSHSRMNKGQLRGGGDMLEVTGRLAAERGRTGGVTVCILPSTCVAAATESLARCRGHGSLSSC